MNIADEDIANPFGHRGCDMPIGGTKALLNILRTKIINSQYEDPNLVIVTGSVVTFQPGQLDYTTHIQTIQEVYLMLKEVFPNSYVYPVMGSNDFFPQNYCPMNTTVNTVYANMTVKDLYRKTYVDFMAQMNTFFQQFFN